MFIIIENHVILDNILENIRIQTWRVPAQDGLFALILCYVVKSILRM